MSDHCLAHFLSLTITLELKKQQQPRLLFSFPHGIGHPRFFLGSDSAPHRVKDKLPTLTSCGGGCAAGIYTSPYLLPILACAFESALGPSKTIISPIGLDRLEGFVSRFGRSFYGLPETTDETDQIRLLRTTDDEKEHDGWVKMEKKQEEEMVVIPFWYGKRLGWKIEG